YEGENYIVEAKWHNQSLSDEPILAFCQKQQMNMHGRGIFISMNGFTEGVLDIVKSASIRNAVLIDGEDLSLVMGQHIGLPNLLDAKIEAAQTKGQFYINPITRVSKIK
ncbi:MAG: restriction endonuclease, partial [Chloroflexota bacterium]|nr:restriction endonuclease [Chloroflexota bacterium]